MALLRSSPSTSPPGPDVAETPVAVVGGGPVGLMLALLLDHHGVRSTVFDTDDGPIDQPRGSTHGARTMEHYRRLGLAGQVRRLGLPWNHATGIRFFTRYDGAELCHLPGRSELDALRAIASASDTDQVPEPMHRANQMYVERLLFDHAATRPRISLRPGTTVTGVRQDPGGVVVEHHDRSPDRTRARFAVGCDGGRSLVRRELGIGYTGTGTMDQEILGGRSVAAHLRIPDLYPKVLGDRRAWSYWAVNHDLALNLITLNGVDEFFLLSSSIDPLTAGPDEIADTVRRAIGAPLEIAVLGQRSWNAGTALVADRFGHGRIMLAGDAAHLFTPNGGFGMNTGIDDAANLAWKLAASVQGWAGPDLPASYEIERRPVALRNTEAARRLNGGLAAIARPPQLEDPTVLGAELRERIGRQLAEYGLATLETLGVQLGARYDSSPLTVAEVGDDLPADDPTSFTPSGVPGGRAPHVWLDDGDGHRTSLFDRLGRGFTLLRLGTSAPAGDGIANLARQMGIPLTIRHLPSDAARGLYGRDLALVRPDQHLAWRGDACPPDPERLLSRLVGGVPTAARQ